MIMRTALLAALWATPALACPTASDLAAGIEITFETDDDPLVLVYSRRDDGALIEREDYGDGVFGFIVADDGVLETAYFEADAAASNPSGMIRYAYDFSVEFPLEPWKSFAGQQTEMTEGESDITIPAKVSVLGTAPLTIGDCTYTATEIRTYYYRDEGFLEIHQDFLGELDAPILRGYHDSGYDGFNYNPVAIRALE